MTTQPKKNILDDMIDLKFRNINRLFVYLYKCGDNDMRDSFDKYYMLLVEVKDFNALIENARFLVSP